MDKPSRITLEEFTEVTLNSTLSALKNQRLIDDRMKLPFPIVFGLIFWPQDGLGQPQVFNAAREGAAGKE